MSVNLGQCIVTLLGHNWDLNSILLFKLLHFNFEWIVFCDLVSCKDNFILHKSDFSCLIWQCWNISGTTMWPQAIGTTSHPNFGMHTGSQGPNPAIFSQNCPNRAMLPGNLLITSKLLVLQAYLIHYFHNSNNKGERPKRTSDLDSTSKNT